MQCFNKTNLKKSFLAQWLGTSVLGGVLIMISVISGTWPLVGAPENNSTSSTVLQLTTDSTMLLEMIEKSMKLLPLAHRNVGDFEMLIEYSVIQRVHQLFAIFII